MPNSPSAIKRLKQSIEAPVAQPDHEEDDQDLHQADPGGRRRQGVREGRGRLPATTAKIDKAGARRVLHPNTAARRKSKLARDYAAAVAKARASA